MLKLQRPPAQALPDPGGEIEVPLWPARIGTVTSTPMARGALATQAVAPGGGGESSNVTISARLGIGAVYCPLNGQVRKRCPSERAIGTPSHTVQQAVLLGGTIGGDAWGRGEEASSGPGWRVSDMTMSAAPPPRAEPAGTTPG